MSLLFLGHPNDHDLALFAGGELGPVARWRIERHLQNCSRCEEAVADFFHLQSEIGELSELPNIDWTLQARMILDLAERSRATSEKAPAPAFGHTWALRAGLALATVICAFVVVRQFPQSKTASEPESQLRLSRSIQDQVAVQAVSEPSTAAAEAEMNRTVASAPVEAFASSEADSSESRQIVGAQVEGGERARSNADEELGSARRESALSTDLPAPAAPAGLRKTQAAPPSPAVAPGTKLAYRGSASQAAEDKRAAAPAQVQLANEGAGRDQAVQSPGRQAENRLRTSGQVAAAEAAADDLALRDRADRNVPLREQGKEKAELQAGSAEASGQKAQARVRIAAARSVGGAAPNYANAGPAPQSGTAPRYSIVPVGSDSPVEMGVAADGAISFRTVDAATGMVTITHVYAQ